MARGRFIENKIVLSKQVSLLSDDTCRLMFTWMITFADREGRLFGDPALIRGTIFPRNEKITIKKVESYLQELSDVGLILRYESKGDKFVLFPGFSDSQIGLRKDKEPESGYPPPTQKHLTEFARNNSATLPDNFRTTSGIVTSEYKLREENDKLRELEEEVEGEPEEEKASSVFFEPLKLFQAVTGMGAIPASQIQQTLPALETLWYQHDKDADKLTAFLKPYFENWTKRKSKNGAFYSKANCSWLYDWAIAGEIPANGNDSPRYQKPPVNQGLEVVKAYAAENGITLDGIFAKGGAFDASCIDGEFTEEKNNG